MTMKPSDFLRVKIYSSVFRKAEYETICRNCIIISKRLGDKWGLTKEDYQRERKKDGNYGNTESGIADEVLPYLESPEKLSSFAPALHDKYLELSESTIPN